MKSERPGQGEKLKSLVEKRVPSPSSWFQGLHGTLCLSKDSLETQNPWLRDLLTLLDLAFEKAHTFPRRYSLALFFFDE